MAEPVATIPVVPPKEALEFFRQKGLAIGFAWQDVWQEEHVRAFTVAKAMSRDLLEDIRAAVDKAMAEGETLETFRKELRPLLEQRGWWGRRSMLDPLTGEQKIVQLGSPRRLKTIFEVNMRTSYAAGRWERAQRTKKAFPFLRYVTAGDAKVRPEHRAWDGVIRPIDDEFWKTHYPPCGWNCRCTAIPVSRSMLERRGWEVTDKPPKFPLEPYTNPRTGEVTRIEKGIDPGFNYNVGDAYLRSLAPRPIGGGGSGGSAAGERAFLDAFDVDAGSDEAQTGKVHFDPTGWPLAIGTSWFRTVAGDSIVPGSAGKDPAALLARVGRTIAAPQLIRLVWIKGDDGAESLVRRYIAVEGEAAIAVDVGRAGWTFRSMDVRDMAREARDGHFAWSKPGGAFAQSYVAEALKSRPHELKMLDLGRSSDRQRARLAALGLADRDWIVAVDGSRAYHSLKGHAGDRREGKALTIEDVAKAERIWNAAKIEKGEPFTVSRVHRVHVRATVDGVEYGGAFEVRSDRVVLQTLYRI